MPRGRQFSEDRQFSEAYGTWRHFRTNNGDWILFSFAAAVSGVPTLTLERWLDDCPYLGRGIKHRRRTIRGVKRSLKRCFLLQEDLETIRSLLTEEDARTRLHRTRKAKWLTRAEFAELMERSFCGVDAILGKRFPCLNDRKIRRKNENIVHPNDNVRRALLINRADVETVLRAVFHLQLVENRRTGELTTKPIERKAPALVSYSDCEQDEGLVGKSTIYYRKVKPVRYEPVFAKTLRNRPVCVRAAVQRKPKKPAPEKKVHIPVIKSAKKFIRSYLEEHGPSRWIDIRAAGILAGHSAKALLRAGKRGRTRLTYPYYPGYQQPAWWSLTPWTAEMKRAVDNTLEPARRPERDDCLDRIIKLAGKPWPTIRAKLREDGYSPQTIARAKAERKRTPAHRTSKPAPSVARETEASGHRPEAEFPGHPVDLCSIGGRPATTVLQELADATDSEWTDLKPIKWWAKIFKVRPRTMQSYIKNGQVKTRKVGRYYSFPLKDIPKPAFKPI